MNRYRDETEMRTAPEHKVTTVCLQGLDRIIDQLIPSNSMLHENIPRSGSLFSFVLMSEMVPIFSPHTVFSPKCCRSNNVLIITFYLPEDTKTAEDSLPQINSTSAHTGGSFHLIFPRITPRDNSEPSNIQSALVLPELGHILSLQFMKSKVTLSSVCVCVYSM